MYYTSIIKYLRKTMINNKVAGIMRFFSFGFLIYILSYNYAMRIAISCLSCSIKLFKSNYLVFVKHYCLFNVHLI